MFSRFYNYSLNKGTQPVAGFAITSNTMEAAGLAKFVERIFVKNYC
jgi:DNA-binding MltR family transcriptional regulator